MKNTFLIILLNFSVSIFAQNGNKTLVTIDGEKTSVADFKRIYEKNLNAIKNEEDKDVAKNLKLFINYKLKVNEAYRIKLDTFPMHKNELRNQKEELIKPYVGDTTVLPNAIKEAYYRTINEVKAKHILIRLEKNALAKDTLAAYNKIYSIREKFLKEGNFEALAVQFSDDDSAQDDPKTGRKGNKGDLGYFSSFSMVYPFETAAFNTKVGQVSQPFRTQFGYHIVKVDDFRPIKGEVEAAHILIKDTTQVGEARIHEVYNKLLKKESFKELVAQYSEDERTIEFGGNIGVFGPGSLVKPFNDAVFSLTEENTFTKPFKTPFGWHIAKMIKIFPISTFEEMKEGLSKLVIKNNLKQLSETVIIGNIKKKYTLVEFEDAKEILNRKDIRKIPKDSLQKVIFSIDDKKYTQEDFVNFMNKRRGVSTLNLFEGFKSEEVVSYFKENLIYTAPEFVYNLNEYKEGLLLFDIMQQKIWSETMNDSLALNTYYNNNLSKYKPKPFEDVKGIVMNDYQADLEEKWVAGLRRKSKIKVNKKQLQELIKFYENK